MKGNDRGADAFMRVRYTFRILGYLFGVERSTIVHNGSTYMDRWILYFGLTLRVHRFARGDLDIALHNHPWWFITFPLQSYTEEYWCEPCFPGCTVCGEAHRVQRVVRRFRPHFRGTNFRHRVLDPLGSNPTWTIVLSGSKAQEWGFFPEPDTFVPWHSYIEDAYDAGEQVRETA